MSRNAWRHAKPRRRIPALAVLVVALIALIAVCAVLVRLRSEPAPRNTRTDDRAGAATAGVEVPDQVPVPMSAAFAWPADLSLVTVAGVDLPVSVQDGPRQRSGGLAKGFSQTPAGAVLAAMHLVVCTSPQVGPAVWQPTLRDQVVGPDAAAFADVVQQDYEELRERLQIPYGQPLGRIYGAIRGVRVDAYSPQAASLRLLIEAPDRKGGIANAVAVVQVSWSNDDWLMVAPPRGNWASVRVLIPPTLVGAFTPVPGR